MIMFPCRTHFYISCLHLKNLQNINYYLQLASVLSITTINVLWDVTLWSLVDMLPPSSGQTWIKEAACLSQTLIYVFTGPHIITSQETVTSTVTTVRTSNHARVITVSLYHHFNKCYVFHLTATAVRFTATCPTLTFCPASPIHKILCNVRTCRHTSWHLCIIIPPWWP